MVTFFMRGIRKSEGREGAGRASDVRFGVRPDELVYLEVVLDLEKAVLQQLAPLLMRHEVRLHWLRGHAGHPENERCDELARQCAAGRDLPPDEGFRPDDV